MSATSFSSMEDTMSQKVLRKAFIFNRNIMATVWTIVGNFFLNFELSLFCHCGVSVYYISLTLKLFNGSLKDDCNYIPVKVKIFETKKLISFSRGLE